MAAKVVNSTTRQFTRQGVIHPKYRIPTSFDPTRPANKQDRLLFTPGPLTTSYPVKLAACRDLGSRDTAFIKVIEEVRSKTLDAAGVSSSDWTTIPMQGSGTYGVEAVLSSVVPSGPSPRLLIIANGAYGLRMGLIADAQKIPYKILKYPDNVSPSLTQIEHELQSTPSLTHVAVVESETTSGIVNDVKTIGQLVHKHNKSFIVDAMSSFGAYPTNLTDSKIDFIVSSSNKCIEGIPGFSLVIARKAALAASKGNARSLSLNIHAQNEGLDKDGQFRFTPPTHALLAFHQALLEHELEGGSKARHERYQANRQVLLSGMAELGFIPYLPEDQQGCIITSYRYPTDSNWDFKKFYNHLNDQRFVIYPGKVSAADCFRIGHIGRLFPEDSQALLSAIKSASKALKTAKFAPK